MTDGRFPKCLRIGIVEDNHEFARLLEGFCTQRDDLTVGFSVASVKAALKFLNESVLDLLFVDIGLPDGSGVEVVKVARQLGTNCLILTVHDDDTHLFSALKAGAAGYLLKDELSLVSLQQALVELQHGGAPMSFSIARRVIEHFRGENREQNLPQLTKRETQVLEQLANGYNARKISELLNISYETVRHHQKNIYRKLQVNSATGAVSKLGFWNTRRS